MKISSLRQYNLQQNKQVKDNNKLALSEPNFTGGFDMFLRFLDTNQAWGATAVDLGCMVVPRTLTDFTRGADAGWETARREGSGTVNHASIGGYGVLAGLALAPAINKAFNLVDGDVKAHSIFADAETLDLHAQIFDNKLKSAQVDSNVRPIKEYIVEALNKYEALSPTKDGQWVRFNNPEKIDEVAEILEKEILKKGNKISKDANWNIRNILVSELGVENNIRIISNDKPHTSRYSVDYVIENLYKLGKTFNKEKVKEAFMNSTSIMENQFLKALKTMNLKRSLLGIGLGSLIGISVQPLNMYITRKKTGKTEFVGGGKEDKSFAFKLRKGLVAGAFGAFVLSTIGNPKNLIKDLQFKGFTPTLKQFKFIYGVTIMSRFLSSRNDNELKEATIKDTLGFTNWLILGNFVQKAIAQALDPSLIKRDGKGLTKWITNSVLKTRDEVLHESLKEKIFKDGKPLSYANMVKMADKATKKKLGVITLAQLAGYAYSGILLGFGIPKLNIYLTKRRMEKQAQQEAKDKPQDIMYSESNFKFLHDKNISNFGFLK